MPPPRKSGLRRQGGHGTRRGRRPEKDAPHILSQRQAVRICQRSAGCQRIELSHSAHEVRAITVRVRDVEAESRRKLYQLLRGLSHGAEG